MPSFYNNPNAIVAVGKGIGMRAIKTLLKRILTVVNSLPLVCLHGILPRPFLLNNPVFYFFYLFILPRRVLD